MAHTMEQARFDIAAAHRLGVKFNINEGVNGGHFTLMALDIRIEYLQFQMVSIGKKFFQKKLS
jgi:hypothetical protein